MSQHPDDRDVGPMCPWGADRTKPKSKRQVDREYAPPATPKKPKAVRVPNGKPLAIPPSTVPHDGPVFKAAPKRKQRWGEFRLKSIAPLRRSRRISKTRDTDDWVHFLASKAAEDAAINMKSTPRRSPRRKRAPRASE